MGNCCESSASEKHTMFNDVNAQHRTIEAMEPINDIQHGLQSNNYRPGGKKPMPMLPSQPIKTDKDAFQKRFDDIYSKYRMTHQMSHVN